MKSSKKDMLFLRVVVEFLFHTLSTSRGILWFKFVFGLKFFNQFILLCFSTQRRYGDTKFMFYYQNQLLPPMFLNLFLTSSQVHNYGTRTANHYRSHSCRTNLKQFTVLYQGPKIWNSLPISILLQFSLLRKKCWNFYP